MVEMRDFFFPLAIHVTISFPLLKDNVFCGVSQGWWCQPLYLSVFKEENVQS